MNTKATTMARIVERQFFGGSMRFHILQLARRDKVFGMGLIEELRRHGYRLSPGTVYPLLHGLERDGYLRSSVEIVAGRQRRLYLATSVGKSALRLSRRGIVGLMHELKNGSTKGRRLERHKRESLPGKEKAARTPA